MGLLCIPGCLQNLTPQPIKVFIDSHSGTGSRGSATRTHWGKHCYMLLLLGGSLKSHSHVDLLVLSEARGKTCHSFTWVQPNLWVSATCSAGCQRRKQVSCASGAFHFSYIDSEKHFFPSPKNPYGVFYKVTRVIPCRPVGSTVTYINVDTFHIMLLFANILCGETTSKKPQTRNTLFQTAASVKWLISASIFAAVLYRW